MASLPSDSCDSTTLLILVQVDRSTGSNSTTHPIPMRTGAPAFGWAHRTLVIFEHDTSNLSHLWRRSLVKNAGVGRPPDLGKRSFSTPLRGFRVLLLSRGASPFGVGASRWVPHPPARTSTLSSRHLSFVVVPRARALRPRWRGAGRTDGFASLPEGWGTAVRRVRAGPVGAGVSARLRQEGGWAPVCGPVGGSGVSAVGGGRCRPPAGRWRARADDVIKEVLSLP